MLQQKIFDEIKKQNRTGRCLHFDNGGQCTEIIDAHSIQRGGQLSKIAENGHVYRVEFDSNQGRLFLKKTGVKKASTFLGFCKTHDNELFKPIDNFPLTPSVEQVALYAYRCLCREFFVKNAVIKAFDNIINLDGIRVASKNFLKQASRAHGLGLENLEYHKFFYDQSLREKSINFNYVVFESNDAPLIQLSGLLYPEYDFEGNQLQEIGSVKPRNQLITYFTAPTSTGWAFCFAWHVTSNKICQEFIRSFARNCRKSENVGAALLRLASSTCENHAFRISWWDGLTARAQDELIQRMTLSAHPETPIPKDYLMSGCEGIVTMNFSQVWASHA